MYRMSRGLLSGSEWYDIQAFRALNQARGLCIRHRKDWGAIILVDNKFVKNQHKVQGLSKWVRRKVQPFQSFSSAIDSINKFTKARQVDMPVVNPDTSFIPGTPVSPGQHIGSQMTSPTTSPYKNNSPDTSFIPGTPVSPGQHIGSQMTSPTTSPYKTGSQTPIGKGFSTKTPLNSIVKSPNTLLGSPDNSTVLSDKCLLMSPTEVHRNQNYQNLVQNRQVVQPQVQTQNNRSSLTVAQPLDHMSQIMLAINSPSAPKDKPFYVIIGQGTPQQQIYLIEPPTKLTPPPIPAVVVPNPSLNEGQTSSKVMEHPNLEVIGQTSQGDETTAAIYWWSAKKI